MIRFPTRADDNEPLTYDSFNTLLAEYARHRPAYRELMEGFREAAAKYQQKRAHIDAAFEARPLTSELHAIRAFEKAKEEMLNDFDNAFMRTVCKTFKNPFTAPVRP